MKTFYSTLIILLICLSSISQNIVKSEKFKISFETTEILEIYETESDHVLGYENDNYAIDIEMEPLKQSLNDLKLITREFAFSLGFQNIVDGGKIPEIKNSYYVIANGLENGESYPVYVVFITNYSLNVLYGITVDCYSQNALEGLKIVYSFKLLD